MSIFSPTKVLSAKFPQPGAVVQGEIVSIGEPVHARKFNSEEPDFWPSGDPKMQVAIKLQTNERDPQEPDDEGVRNLWVVVSGTEGGQLWAIRQALRAQGLKDLAVGGYLAVMFTKHDPNSQNPQNPKKLYEARYQPPASGGGVFGEQQAAPQQQKAQGAAPQGFQSAQQQTPAQQAAPMQGGWPQQQSQQAAAPTGQQAPAPQQVNQQTGEITGGGFGGGQQAPQQQAPAAAPQAGQVDTAAQVKALLSAGMTDQQISATTGATPETIQAIRNLA
ncbi:hypothetical protein [Zhihengliuella flava]|uniref:Uncharacterized protein n=1 Tax=Zhihengliuella flava TaxID=1285193 RepID=A0A931DAC5_9MICC|nr:hypothetical protein [Zhihengliuella flava]MBG6083273.1 hypothetical protein [Zhihengliuella flava]